jgi:hypothetical protein
MKLFKDRCERSKYTDLAQYNSEVARGLMHTDEWKRQMSELQKAFNDEHYATPNRGEKR